MERNEDVCCTVSLDGNFNFYEEEGSGEQFSIEERYGEDFDIMIEKGFIKKGLGSERLDELKKFLFI